MPTIPKHITVKTPARICLFGDHQDYLGLPIIACAINKYMTFKGTKNSSQSIEIILPDIQERRRILLDGCFETTTKRPDFFLAGLRVVKRYGCIPSKGYTVTISSDIPINAGVSSSSALTVGWIHFLLNAFGSNQETTPQFLAQLAYEAEVVEHNSPGGKMDQYTIALGTTIYLETGEATRYKYLGNNLQGLILAESGIVKETIDTLKNTRELAEKAIEMVTAQQPDFDIYKATILDSLKYKSIVGTDFLPYLEAAIANHRITQKALIEFQKSTPNPKLLGELMSQHHTMLKEKLQVSHPTIDTMLEAATTAGAYGGKIVGSGGGGCAVALVPKEKGKAVIDAFLKAGATKVYPVSISNGSSAYGN